MQLAVCRKFFKDFLPEFYRLCLHFLKVRPHLNGAWRHYPDMNLSVVNMWPNRMGFSIFWRPQGDLNHARA